MDLEGAIGLPEAARRYSVTQSTIRRWVDRGRFPHPLILPFGTWRFQARDIERFDQWLADRSMARRTGAIDPPMPEWHTPAPTDSPADKATHPVEA